MSNPAQQQYEEVYSAKKTLVCLVSIHTDIVSHKRWAGILLDTALLLTLAQTLLLIRLQTVQGTVEEVFAGCHVLLAAGTQPHCHY